MRTMMKAFQDSKELRIAVESYYRDYLEINDIPEDDTYTHWTMAYMTSFGPAYTFEEVQLLLNINYQDEILPKYGPIEEWDVSNITDFSRLFAYKLFFNADIRRWDTSNALYVADMFLFTKNFNYDISGWSIPNITGKVYFNVMFGMYMSENEDNDDNEYIHNMRGMFSSAYNNFNFVKFSIIHGKYSHKIFTELIKRMSADTFVKVYEFLYNYDGSKINSEMKKKYNIELSRKFPPLYYICLQKLAQNPNISIFDKCFEFKNKKWKNLTTLERDSTRKIAIDKVRYRYL